MTKATVKVNIGNYVKYWEKAVKQSMKQMEYLCQYEIDGTEHLLHKKSSMCVEGFILKST